MAHAAQLTLISPKGAFIKPLIESALRSELNLIELGLSQTEKRLHAFESQHGMSSGEFYRALTADEIDETMETVEWAGEYKTWLRLQDKRDTLLELEIAN